MKTIELNITTQAAEIAALIAAFELQGVAYSLRCDGIAIVAITITGA